MNPSPEWKILLACARTKMNGDGLQRLRDELVDASLDWDRISERACQHGIAPLIYYNLQRMGVTDLLSQATMDVLKNFYYGNAVRNKLLYNELNRVLCALKEMECEVIVLKGAALAETVYPNRALRPMSDVDLLVRKEDVSRVEDKLVAMGYLLSEHPETKEWLKEHYYHLVFVKNGAIPIEIHWNIDRPSRLFKVDINGMWGRALPAKIADVEALVLSPEDLLLHLCQHTACHHLLIGGLRPFCDIYEVIRHYGHTIDWLEVQNRASQWGIKKYVHLTLHLARELLRAAVPDAVVEAVEPDDFDARRLGWAQEKILADRGTSPMSSNIVQFWKGRRLKEKLAILPQIFSPEVIAKNYSVSPTSKRVYFYYPARLKDLFLRYGPMLGRLLCRDPQLKALLEREQNISQLDEWLADFSVSTPERVSEKW